MLQHFIKVTLRTIKQHSDTFAINMLSLSTGLACILLIYLWVDDEMRIDKFHRNDAALYQVLVNEHSGDYVSTSEGTSGTLGEALENEFPEVKYATATTPPDWFQKFTVSAGRKDISGVGTFVGKDFFNVFTYALLEGEASQVLNNKNSIVISENLARKLFNTTQNVVGRDIEWKWHFLTKSATVSGVFKNITRHSTQQFDFALPFEVWNEVVPPAADIAQGPFFTYLVLEPSANAQDFHLKISDFINARFQEIKSSLLIRKYSDGYLYGKYENGKQVGGRIENIKRFSLIGLVILVIACINFINLSTAKASTRVKEVGVKKTVGASRQSLFGQYLAESMVISLMSLFIAGVIMALLLPSFNEITGKQLTQNIDIKFVLSAIGLACITGLIAGIYPALYLSLFNPLSGLNAKINTTISEVFIRKGLVCFQFLLSMIFIVFVFVIYKQVEYIEIKDVGFDRKNIIYFETEGRVASALDNFLKSARVSPVNCLRS